MRSQASVITLVCCLIFICVVFCFFRSLFRYWYGRESGPHLAKKVIMVNMPDSFREYMDEEAVELDRIIIEKEWEAYFDLFTFSDWMEEERAFMVVVFPEDFDKKILKKSVKNKPEILTYCSSEYLEYTEKKKDFCERYLDEGYFLYIQDQMGVPVTDMGVPDIWLDGAAGESPDNVAVDRFAHMVMPLLFFIAVMYTCMLSGMNAIAGEKERGTFAALLMTPISRTAIVLGNYLGVVLHAAIPVVILLVPIAIFDFGIGALGVLLLSISLILLMAGITILISCMSNSIVSAQTAFLPIFLIVLVACVTCMQQTTINPVNYYIPIYGHFYGIGDCLMGTASVLPVLICSVTTILLAAVCILVSRRLLMTEAFTVAVESKSDKEIRKAAERAKKEQHDYVSKARANVFGYRPTRRKPVSRFLLGHAMLPLALLSVFQTTAMIPAIISYMKTPESVEFFRMFRELSGITEIWDAVRESGKLFSQFMQNTYFILFMGIGYWCIIGIYMLLVRFRDGQSLATMGFPRRIPARTSDAQGAEQEPAGSAQMTARKAAPWKIYLKGLLLGLLLISSVYGLLLMTRQITCEGFSLSAGSVPLFILYILMWIPQGATEEIMMRGYMLPRVASRFGVPFAVFFSSLCFSVMHALNAGFTILALVNLILIAALFAMIALRDGHIYRVCAMHTMWNLCQGNLFGLEVSGNAGDASILRSFHASGARDLLTGGAFGPEGGLCVTIVIALAFLIFFVSGARKRRAAGSGSPKKEEV
ncbi:MAG: ABC transporter permease [Clostridiales bacterium]|nr:ABC transporter permease [Clostridiales bacterium]